MRKRVFPLHTIIFALYPIIAIYAINLGKVDPLVIFRPLVIGLLFGLIILLLTRVILRDWLRAGLVTSLFLILFFSYGHVYRLLEEVNILGFTLGRHRNLIILWTAIFIIGTWLIWKRLKDPRKATATVNVIAIAALVVPIFSITTFFGSEVAHTLSTRSQGKSQQASEVSQTDSPDVYYIILDAYGRHDVLEKVYQYDNSALLNELKNLGFYVVDQSRSNYNQTVLSLIASLNMDYVDQVVTITDPDSNPDYPWIDHLKRSQVRQMFESMGYDSVSFNTGYFQTEIEDADFYLVPPEETSEEHGGVTGRLSSSGTVNSLEVMLLRSSGFVLFTDIATRCLLESDQINISLNQGGDSKDGWLRSIMTRACNLFGWLESSMDYPFKEHRERILFMLDTLPDVPDTDNPRFVFAHVVAPHFPYVFGPDGEVGPYLVETGLPFWYFEGTRGTYIDGYVGQITYVDKRIQQVVEEILTQSEVEPIIIIQADHGPDASSFGTDPPKLDYFSERFPILNVIYLPSYCSRDQLYPSMTPVNTFRLVFNACFQGDYELLEDRNITSPYGKPFRFTDVTELIVP
jgi:hypothetical protein